MDFRRSHIKSEKALLRGLRRGFVCWKGVGMFLVLVILGLAGLVQAQPPDTLWTYTYASSVNDEAYTIAQTLDGGFVVGGRGRAPDSTYGALLIRLDRDGNELWVQSYTEFAFSINSVVTTNDGGFAMTGDERPNLLCAPVLKTDSVGAVQWSMCISERYSQPGVSIAEAADGGFAALIVGNAIPSSYIHLVRLDPEGDSLWTQSFGGSGIYMGGAVLATTDSGFLSITSFDYQAYIAKTDNNGVIQWSTIFGASNLTERPYAVDVTAEGDYIIAGTQTRSAFTFNPYAARLTSSGDTLWTRAYPELGPAWFYSIYELPNRDIVFGGSTGSSYLLVMCDADGSVIWSQLYGTPHQDDCRSMCLALEDGVAIAGYKGTLASNSRDIWVVRTGSVLETGRRPVAPPLSFMLLPNYPNPFNSFSHIRFDMPRSAYVTLTVFDVTGRAVAVLTDEVMAAGTHGVIFDGGGLPSGVYFARLNAGGFAATRKLLLLR